MNHTYPFAEKTDHQEESDLADSIPAEDRLGYRVGKNSVFPGFEDFSSVARNAREEGDDSLTTPVSQAL